ncbi:MAG: methionyl-tRNA formyltransferase [Flavobacteriales bacterium]|nr:methionyl-tRNA formyltransferase [Flavobacteriales bacterium]
MRIVFYGTPDFAVTSLERILEAGFNLVAVVTAPDKPSGRGMKLKSSPVKECAVKHGIPVLQPQNLKSDEFEEQLKSLDPDLQVIIAFRMLPEKVWNFPEKGTVNLHASLLPQYRGAAPINRAIINGETETGVTTFFLKHEIDTGDLLLQKKVTINPDDTAGTLHDKLMNVGADLMVETLRGIVSNTLEPVPQKDILNLKTAPKIFPKDCEINWYTEGLKIKNLIRGLSPYPGAYTHHQNKILKIYSCRFEKGTPLKAGDFEKTNSSTLRISCMDGYIYPEWVQPEGKRKMNVLDYLNGLK